MPVVVEWFVQPLGLVFVSLLIGLVLVSGARGMSGLQRIVLIGSTFFLWVCSAPLPANTLMKWMETPSYSVPASCSGSGKQSDPATHSMIVVLGADLDAHVESDNPYRVLSQDSLIRTLHAASLDSGSNRFFLMGGGQTSRKLSDFMAMVLAEQGVPDTRIVRDRLSRSTQQNAERLLELLSSDTSVPITLVTSSLHMNRAVQIFEDHGFIVCPSSSASLYSAPVGVVGLLPYITALNKTTLAFRELLATLKYQILGSISH